MVRDTIQESVAQGRDALKEAYPRRAALEAQARQEAEAEETRRKQDEAARAAEAEAELMRKHMAAIKAAKAKIAAERRERLRDVGLTEGDEIQLERKSDLDQRDYARCKKNFRECTGKFIRFEGVVTLIIRENPEGTLVRIATTIHGFDVQTRQRVPESVLGSKVQFSGNLLADHWFNDDVGGGQIDDVLMNPSEVCRTSEGNVQHTSSRAAGGRVKTDMLGFFPGMRVDKFNDRLSNGGFRERVKYGCGTITGEFTEQLDPNLVKTVKFQFLSGTPPLEMIAQVTGQFNTAPTKADWRQEIARATQGRPCQIFGSSTWCVGGLIASWQLDEGHRLELTLNRPASGRDPNDFILAVTSQAVARL